MFALQHVVLVVEPVAVVVRTIGGDGDAPDVALPSPVGRVDCGAVEGGALQWVRPSRLRNYSMPAADLPLIPILQDLL